MKKVNFLLIIIVCIIMQNQSWAQTNKFEKIGSLKTILSQIEIYSIWTDDMLNPQIAAGIIFESKSLVILIRPEYMDSLLTSIDTCIEKASTLYNGPELTHEERTIAKLPIKFEQEYEAQIKWMPMRDETRKGVVYVNFIHEGNDDSSKTVCLMMYVDQAQVFVRALKKAIVVAKDKADQSKI